MEENGCLTKRYCLATAIAPAIVFGLVALPSPALSFLGCFLILFFWPAALVGVVTSIYLLVARTTSVPSRWRAVSILATNLASAWLFISYLQRAPFLGFD